MPTLAAPLSPKALPKRETDAERVNATARTKPVNVEGNPLSSQEKA